MGNASSPLSSIPQKPLPAGHPDLAVIQPICAAIERLAGGWPAFEREIPRRIRLALDEVIDAPRTGRFVLSECEKTELTYVGTKIEILIRDFLGLKKGVLDLVIDGVHVDVKNTIGLTWMIPREAIGHPCILVQENERTARCSVGIIVAHLSNLTSSNNQDGKKSVSATGKANIHWLLHQHPYPRNFWETVASTTRIHIASGSGGTARLFRLFQAFPQQPIPRFVAETVARQKDFMKRLRGNGGVRDLLSPLGVVLLSGVYDQDLAKVFGVQLADDEFAACRVKTPSQLAAVRRTGRHPGVDGFWTKHEGDD